MYKRLFNWPKEGHSFFLFGPRQTGKSTLVSEHLGEGEVFKVDFLEEETLLKYKTTPGLLRQEAEDYIQRVSEIKPPVKPVLFIDEVQKASEILDGIQLLLTRYPHAQFILTGSSARKLKRGGANLLAGRALQYNLHPLTFLELENKFHLETQLARGSLPPFVDLDDETCARFLRAYVSTYLKEEILEEALIRKLVPFNRFLEICADQNGQLVNYSNVARDIGIASKTVQDYYRILEDTLLCFRLFPYLKGERKRLIHQSRYYLFDLGVTNVLAKRPLTQAVPRTELYGRQFEHFIILECFRLNHYFEKGWEFFHWRTTAKKEVDLVLVRGDELIACEIKAKDRIDAQDVKDLWKFSSEHPKARLICISLCERHYTIGEQGMPVEVWPWQDSLNSLFS